MTAETTPTNAAAVTVRAALKELEAHGPKHYKDLAKALFHAGLGQRGKDPEYTVYADLFFAVKAAHPRLRMVGRGVFALDTHGDVNGADYAPSRSTAAKKPEDMTLDELKGYTDDLIRRANAATTYYKARLAAAQAPKVEPKTPNAEPKATVTAGK